MERQLSKLELVVELALLVGIFFGLTISSQAQDGNLPSSTVTQESRTVVIAPASEPLPNGAVPAESKTSLAPHPTMTENQDGELKAGEYEVVSMNGSITRALCPYTCEARGLPKQNCKSWKSVQEPDKCYLQDTRLPSNAVPFSGQANAGQSHSEKTK